MIPETALGLLLLVVAVLPGLTYTLAFERRAGAYGVTLADRTLRFTAVSAVFHVLAGWPEYWVWRTTLAAGGPIDAGRFAILWAAAVLLLVLPAACSAPASWIQSISWPSELVCRKSTVRSSWPATCRHSSSTSASVAVP